MCMCVCAWTNNDKAKLGNNNMIYTSCRADKRESQAFDIL